MPKALVVEFNVQKRKQLQPASLSFAELRGYLFMSALSQGNSDMGNIAVPFTVTGVLCFLLR